MNRFIIVTAACVAFSFTGCQDAKEDLNNPLSEKDHYKTIGEEIPFDTGMEWIEYYRKKRYDEGRTQTASPYFVSKPLMETLIESTPDFTGIAFHYGLDDAGATHIILIPVDGSLLLWSAIEGRIFIDANTGSAIAQEVAAQWAGNYKAANPSSVWFHFFGKNIFDDIAMLPFYTGVDIEPAINVLNMTPQLLLVIWNEEGSLLGRTMEQNAVVYDASNACPPCAAR